MEKWQLQAVKREGYTGVWRAGRHWPSGAPVEVEVLDEGQDDPKIDVADTKAPGGNRKALDPHRLSRASFEQLLKDGRISKFRVGDDTAVQDQAALRAQVEDLKAQLAQATGEVSRLQAALAKNVTDQLLGVQASIEPGTPPAQASPEAEALAKNPPAPPPAPESEPEFHQEDHHPTPAGKKPRR